jgi:hypothetical protein
MTEVRIGADVLRSRRSIASGQRQHDKKENSQQRATHHPSDPAEAALNTGKVAYVIQ